MEDTNNLHSGEPTTINNEKDRRGRGILGQTKESRFPVYHGGIAFLETSMEADSVKLSPSNHLQTIPGADATFRCAFHPRVEIVAAKTSPIVKKKTEHQN